MSKDLSCTSRRFITGGAGFEPTQAYTHSKYYFLPTNALYDKRLY
jgi:hypothetical protein